MRHHHELEARLKPGDASDEIARFWDTNDLEERAGIVNTIVSSTDPRVSGVLHYFLRLVAADPRGTGRGGNAYWSAQASVLVRFGLAGFVMWYGNGPVPDRDEISKDVERYLETHDEPPPMSEQQAIWTHGPPPNPTTRRNK